MIGSGLIATPAATARCPHRTPEARGEDRLHCFVSLSSKGQSRENEANLPSRVSLAPHTPRRKVASGGLPRLVDKHPARARKFSFFHESFGARNSPATHRAGPSARAR